MPNTPEPIRHQTEYHTVHTVLMEHPLPGSTVQYLRSTHCKNMAVRRVLRIYKPRRCQVRQYSLRGVGIVQCCTNCLVSSRLVRVLRIPCHEGPICDHEAKSAKNAVGGFTQTSLRCFISANCRVHWSPPFFPLSVQYGVRVQTKDPCEDGRWRRTS
jgi:hypothetical protein